MEDKERCNPETCQYHALTDAVIDDLKEAVHKLMEGQEQMKETVIQLAEAFKYMDRIDKRLEKLEDLQREKDHEQDEEIKELKGFMYKASGVAVGAGGIIGYLTQLLTGG